MNTKAKSNSVITHSVSPAQDEIAFEVIGVGVIRMDLTALHGEVMKRAAIHGMIQRISDAAAIGRDPATGESATAQDKYNAMARLVEHYESGTSDWTRVRTQGEGNSGGLLFRALCQMSPSKDPMEIKGWMDGKTKAQLNAIRNSERVASVINSLRPVSLEVDVDAELADLGIE